MPTPRAWNSSYSSMHPFEAKYRGTCAGCDEHFEPGDHVEYRQGALYIAHHTHDDPLQMDVEDSKYPRVMPRGAKASDACTSCFQIPSSNGTCGCPS